MKQILVTFAVLALVSCAFARPKYIAIPIEDIQFLNLAPIAEQRAVRVAREAVYELPEIRYAQDSDSAASEDRYARQAGNHHADHHDYVDYGAHTGHHGAFGWYADYPVHATAH